jgi:hypothetical protein
MEILFDLQISSTYNDLINSRILAQIILFGISFKPILYFILLIPSKILFKFKCYTSIHIDHKDEDLLDNQQKSMQCSRRDRYSLRLSLFHPKIHFDLPRLSTPILSNTRHSIDIHQNQDISNPIDS